MIKLLQSRSETIAKLAGVGLGFSIPISNALTNICVVILVIAWCCSGITPKLKFIFSRKATWAILGFILVYLLGVTYSIADFAEIKLMLHKMSRLLLIPILMSLFTDSKWRRYAIYSFLFAIIISLLIIIIKYFICLSGGCLLEKLYFIRLPDFLIDPAVVLKDKIFTSLFFSFAIFLLLHLAKEATISKKTTYFGTIYFLNTARMGVYFLAFVFFIYLFTYCEGRSGHIICLVLIEIFFLQHEINWKKIFLLNVLLSLIIATILHFTPGVKENYLLIKNETEAFANNYCRATEKELESATGLCPPALTATGLPPLHNQSTGLRLEFLKNSLKIVKTSPLVGYGSGSFRYIYNKTYPLYDDAGVQLQVKNPHNQYVLTMVELGMFGILLLIAMFCVLLLESTFLPMLEKFLVQGLIFSILVGCTVNSWLMDFASMHYFVYFAGVLFAAFPAATPVLSSTGKRARICA